MSHASDYVKDLIAGKPMPALPKDNRLGCPWVVSEQYGMKFVLNQHNEIVFGDDTCRWLGDDIVRVIVEAVNARHGKDH